MRVTQILLGSLERVVLEQYLVGLGLALKLDQRVRDVVFDITLALVGEHAPLHGGMGQLSGGQVCGSELFLTLYREQSV